MMGVIDRFEGDFAVVELDNGKMININKKNLPETAAEGDVLNISDEITVNEEETQKRRAKIEKLTRNLWK